MNRSLTYILVAGASALAGCVAGYFFAKKQLESKLQDEYEKAVNEEIKKIRDSKSAKKKEEEVPQYLSTDGGFNPEDYASNNFYQDFINDMESEEVTMTNDLEEVAKVKAQTVNLMDEEDEDELEEVVDDDDIVMDNPEEDLGSFIDQPPQLITDREYSALPTIFEFSTIKYFAGDDVLCDEMDQPIDDVERAVGDALTHFGEEAFHMSGDPDRIYVVNGNYRIAYEIERYEMSYAEYCGFKS